MFLMKENCIRPLSYFKNKLEIHISGIIYKNQFTSGINLRKYSSKINNQEDIVSEKKNISSIYPSPKNTLHNAFDGLAKELNNSDLKLQPHFASIKEKNFNKISWLCTYNLKWPESLKFSANANTKQEASKKAALAALIYLRKHEKITKFGELNHLVQKNEDGSSLMKLETITEVELSEINYEKMIELNDEYSRIEEKLKSNEIKTKETKIEHSNSNDLELGKVQLLDVPPKFLPNVNYNAKEKIDLPILKYKEQFMNLLKHNRIVIVKGEPGCGKSTRIPQYVLESWLRTDTTKLCRIAVTQPRRIAAISLAERVANERDETVGNIVGYQVRLKSNFKPISGRILYCTTGILLRHIQSDPNLTTFSHIILDEAHERDVNTDLLLNLVKTNILKANNDLKVIVMSATIDTNLFQQYLNDAPLISIPGFSFPVEANFLPEIIKKLDLNRTAEMCKNHLPAVVHEDVVKLIRFIHKNERKTEGAILCFLPGWEDISKIQRLLLSQRRTDMSVLCLHSRLQDNEQWKIFSSPPPGVRKIILATNIAETSVTINDVVHVIDTGLHKETRFDIEKGVNCVDLHWISKSSMVQRRGRAGRVRPGTAYHLYYPDNQLTLQYSVPEILRTSLTKIVLDTKLYNYNNNPKNITTTLDFMSNLPTPPPQKTIESAINELRNLELIDDEEKLTPLGRILANFQLEPKMSKTLFNSIVYKCVTPIVDIITLYSNDSELFSSGLIDRNGVKRIKQKYSYNSDHLALMRLLEKWLVYINEGDYEASKFCERSNLVQHRLLTIEKLRRLHFEYLLGVNNQTLPISDLNSDCDEMVKGVLYSGVGSVLQHRNFQYIKGRFKKASVFYTNNDHKATITSDSVNFHKEKPSNFLVYINEIRSNIRKTTLIRECSEISPLSILLFSNCNLEIKQIDEDKVLILFTKSKFKFKCSKNHAERIIGCRNAIRHFYNYYIFQMTKGGGYDSNINKIWDNILKILSEILADKHNNK